MKAGILGPGDVGKALGKRFIKYGHQVLMGSRSPESDKVQSWVQQEGEPASAGTYEESASYGEVVVLAVPWSGAENTVNLAGRS